jgi:hypothetical protein
LPWKDRGNRFLAMSVADILEELPKLTAEERSAVLRRLRELDDRDGLLFLNEAADSMFREMDHQEAQDARRKAG